MFGETDSNISLETDSQVPSRFNSLPAFYQLPNPLISDFLINSFIRLFRFLSSFLHDHDVDNAHAEHHG